jgi:hypothetical protein
MTTRPESLTVEDEAVLQRVATRVVDLRMEVPAILTLEGGLPMSVIAGQTLHFFQPVVQAMFRLPDYQRFATLVERRDALQYLTALIEARADEAHRARKETAKARKAARHGRH